MAALNVASHVPFVSINDCARLIRTVGHDITVIIESEPGCGKSSILRMLREQMGDDYEYVYLDCPTLGDGDLGMNIPDRDTKTLEFFVSALLKLDSGKPLVIMLDEYLKCDKLLKKMFTRLMLEREIGDRALPAGSLVFATSNNRSDGVNDTIEAHVGNRVMRVKMAKPNHITWGTYATNKGLVPLLRAWVAFEKKALVSYLQLSAEDLRDNPYIFNPAKPDQVSFVSPRSLEKSDVVIRNRTLLGDDLTLAALAGTLGESAAQSLMTFALLEKDLVPIPVILKDPMGAPLATSAGAVMLTLFHAVDAIDTQDQLSAMVRYSKRLPSEEYRAVFFSMLCESKRTVKLAMQNADLRDWYKDANNRDLVN
jgi:hypothetical protein